MPRKPSTGVEQRDLAIVRRHTAEGGDSHAPADMLSTCISLYKSDANVLMISKRASDVSYGQLNTSGDKQSHQACARQIHHSWLLCTSLGGL